MKRQLRRRELVVVHCGLDVDHTGPPTLSQRAWLAVLALWPAALARESVVHGLEEDRPLHVAVGHRRSVRPPAGVVVHRPARLHERVRWNVSPPAVIVEHAVIDLAAAAASRGDVVRAFTLLADACQSRRTTTERLVAALAGRRKVPGRAVLVELLGDLAAGACSVLEREWLRVERAHGLPAAVRPVHHQAAGRSTYRDAEHADLGVVVEVDGRASTTQRLPATATRRATSPPRWRTDP